MVSGSRPVRRLFFIASSIKEFCTASNLFYELEKANRREAAGQKN
jgi:hypothetical protein